MSTIQLRRGTKAQLDTISLAVGELGYTTDTDEVYAGDGTNNHLIGGVGVGLASGRPSAGVSGRIYHETDTDATLVDDGVSWVNISSTLDLSTISGDLDDIDDGIGYGKVLQTELSNGVVSQINDETNVVTASEARTHIDLTDGHESINDSGTSTSELWSSQKIGDEIATVVSGIDPQESVISQLNLVTSEPAIPTIGDRYINTASGDTSTTSQAVLVNNIYEWNGSDWTETIVSEGMHTWDETLDSAYIFNNSWVKFGSTVTHNNLSSLQGGTTDQYYHVTASEKTVVSNTSGTNTGDQASGDFDHDSLVNTHNLTTDINHATITGGHNLTTDIDHNNITNSHNLTTDIDHDSLLNFQSGEHFLQGAISIPSGQISDFNEASQDSIGGILTDTVSIDLTYDDAGGTIKADLLLADGGTFV